MEKKKKNGASWVADYPSRYCQYIRDFQEYPVDILPSAKLMPFFFLFSMDISRNILTLVSTLKALANLEILLGISVEKEEKRS